VPVAPFDSNWPKVGEFCGSWFSTSAVFTAPVNATVAALVVCTGLIAVRFGCGMREPVTTTSVTCASLVSAAAGAVDSVSCWTEADDAVGAVAPEPVVASGLDVASPAKATGAAKIASPPIIDDAIRRARTLLLIEKYPQE